VTIQELGAAEDEIGGHGAFLRRPRRSGKL